MCIRIHAPFQAHFLIEYASVTGLTTSKREEKRSRHKELNEYEYCLGVVAAHFGIKTIHHASPDVSNTMGFSCSMRKLLSLLLLLDAMVECLTVVIFSLEEALTKS